MEALENAAKTHSPARGGEIIPCVYQPHLNGQLLKEARVGPCDVTKKEDLENVVAQIGKNETCINLLITNAGISGPKAEPESDNASELKERLFHGETFSEWSDTFNTNVSAVYVCWSVNASCCEC